MSLMVTLYQNTNNILQKLEMPSSCAYPPSCLVSTCKRKSGVSGPYWTINRVNLQSSAKLDVEFLEDVEWNKEAFEQLLIDDSTKELVEAVVTHQLKEEGDTDLIRGKGNGLFILLHG